MTQTITDLAQVKNYPEGTPIAALEATVKVTFRCISGTNNFTGQPDYFQGLVLIDDNGNEMNAAASRSDAPFEGADGKRVRLESVSGPKGGWNGVKIKADKREQGATQIWITDAAVINFLGSGAPAAAPSRAPAPPHPNPQPQHQSGSGLQSLPRSEGAGVGQRVSDYFRLFEMVVEQAGKSSIEGLTLQDLREITTHINIGLEKGHYNERDFGERVSLSSPPQPPAPTFSQPAAPSAGGIPASSWKQFPLKSGETLEQVTQTKPEQFTEMVRWAMATSGDRDSQQARVLRANILAAASELDCLDKATLVEDMLFNLANQEGAQVQKFLNSNYGVQDCVSLSDTALDELLRKEQSEDDKAVLTSQLLLEASVKEADGNNADCPY